MRGEIAAAAIDRMSDLLAVWVVDSSELNKTEKVYKEANNT